MNLYFLLQAPSYEVMRSELRHVIPGLKSAVHPFGRPWKAKTPPNGRVHNQFHLDIRIHG